MFSTALTVICIIVALLAGMMLNEAEHQRRRMKRANKITEAARRCRAVMHWRQP